MENKELLGIMEKCGHFLYHRRGIRRGQLKLLCYLKENGEVTQKELIEGLTLKSGTVSEVVKKLEAQGFVKKEKDVNDKRKVNLSLTEKGDSFRRERLQVSKAQEEVLFDGLSIEEQAQLNHLLTKLFEDWGKRFDSDAFKHIDDRTKISEDK